MDTRPAKPKRKFLKYSFFTFLALVLIAIAYFLWWGLTPLGPSDDALNALKGNDKVVVTDVDNSLVFTPKATNATAGYIFYPGGHVDARSYAIYASEVAEQGYLVVIPKMPLSLAVFGINRADGIITKNPQIKRWVIGGHSLGGAMAASYAANNTRKLAGLVLLASYAPNGSDLSKSNLRVVSLLGTLDTVINRASIEAGRSLLPASTEYKELEGGNHGQFGSYGNQPGDNHSPTMSASEQRQAAVVGTVSVLK